MSTEIEKAREWRLRTGNPLLRSPCLVYEGDDVDRMLAAYHASRTAERPQGSAAAVSPEPHDAVAARGGATKADNGEISAAEHPTGESWTCIAAIRPSLPATRKDAMNADKRKEIAERHASEGWSGDALCLGVEDACAAMREYAALVLEEVANQLCEMDSKADFSNWLEARAAQERKG